MTTEMWIGLIVVAIVVFLILITVMRNPDGTRRWNFKVPGIEASAESQSKAENTTPPPTTPKFTQTRGDSNEMNLDKSLAKTNATVEQTDGKKNKIDIK